VIHHLTVLVYERDLNDLAGPRLQKARGFCIQDEKRGAFCKEGVEPLLNPLSDIEPLEIVETGDAIAMGNILL